MATPINYGFPARRPGIITAANFLGPDDDLALQVEYTNPLGIPAIISFSTRNAGAVGEICLPTTATINDLTRDAIIASVRMALFLGSHKPWTAEALSAFVNQEQGQNFQLAIGKCTIVATRFGANDSDLQFDIRKSSGGAVRTISTTIDEIARYTMAPSTQLRVIAGAIEAQFTSYVHDHPNVALTSQQKADIASYVLTLAPWV